MKRFVRSRWQRAGLALMAYGVWLWLPCDRWPVWFSLPLGGFLGWLAGYFVFAEGPFRRLAPDAAERGDQP